jgi:hypothetical protein
MGLIGGALLLLGLGACVLGLVGIVLGVWELSGTAVLSSVGVLFLGLVMGGIAAAILE